MESNKINQSWCQFHQLFMSSFYTSRSQKCKKDSQVKQLFVLSGSLRVKAACTHVGEIDPCAPDNTPLRSTEP